MTASEKLGTKLQSFSAAESEVFLGRSTPREGEVILEK